MDRPDPFDDLEFETAEPATPEEVAAAVEAPPPAPAPAPAAEAAAAADEPESEPADTATPAHGWLGYATLGTSALALVGTVIASVLVIAKAPEPAPKVSPEAASLVRVEALLGGQQAKLNRMAAQAAAAAQPATPPSPAADPAALAQLAAAVAANGQAIDRLPGLVGAQIARLPRPAAAAPMRQVVMQRAPAAAPNVAEVLRAQQGIQRQLDALAARMAKTAAACVTQNDGQIRYP